MKKRLLVLPLVAILLVGGSAYLFVRNHRPEKRQPKIVAASSGNMSGAYEGHMTQVTTDDGTVTLSGAVRKAPEKAVHFDFGSHK